MPRRPPTRFEACWAHPKDAPNKPRTARRKGPLDLWVECGVGTLAGPTSSARESWLTEGRRSPKHDQGRSGMVVNKLGPTWHVRDMWGSLNGITRALEVHIDEWLLGSFSKQQERVDSILFPVAPTWKNSRANSPRNPFTLERGQCIDMTRSEKRFSRLWSNSASSWVSRPPVLGLVARQFLGWSPASS